MKWNAQSERGAISGLDRLGSVNINPTQHLSSFVFPGQYEEVLQDVYMTRLG